MNPKKTSGYDVIILGGRIAGASLATNLARQGARVAVVEAAVLGSNTLSTHFLWPRAVSYLRRLGVSSAIENGPSARSQINFSLNGHSIVGQVPARQTQARLQSVHGTTSVLASDLYSCVRRQNLDRLLLDTAAEAGADVYMSTRMEGVVADKGYVTALKASGGKTAFELRAPIIVAADGRSSTLAQILKVPFKDYRDISTASCWSYFSGLPVQDVRLAKRGDRGFGAATTNDGLTMVLVWGPEQDAATYLNADEKEFQQLVADVDGDFAELLATLGKKEERFYRVSKLASFKRESTFSNVILVGDAACFKDQCTASGITHALRDSELAAEAINSFRSGRLSLSSAFHSYATKRELDVADYFDFACNAAAMKPPTHEELSLIRLCQNDPKLAIDFLSASGDSLPIQMFNNSLTIKSTPDRKGRYD